MANIVEQKAMKTVMEYEKSKGRKPKDVSKQKCGYDIKNNPKLKILEPDVIFKNTRINTAFLLTAAVINRHGREVEL